MERGSFVKPEGLYENPLEYSEKSARSPSEASVKTGATVKQGTRHPGKAARRAPHGHAVATDDAPSAGRRQAGKGCFLHGAQRRAPARG